MDKTKREVAELRRLDMLTRLAEAVLKGRNPGEHTLLDPSFISRITHELLIMLECRNREYFDK